MNFLSLLEKHFPPPEFFIFPQVANVTGFNRQVRYLDAIAISLFPSRGVKAIGMEFKEQRSDWLREKNKPFKAEAIARYCDQFYLVSAENVVELEEVPEGWGWLELKDKTYTRKKAPLQTPEPWDKLFAAALLRRGGEYVENLKNNWRYSSEVQAEIEKRVNAQQKVLELDLNPDLSWKEKYETLHKQVKEFQEASGLADLVWNGKGVGEAVKIISSNNYLRTQLKWIEESAAKARAELEALPKLEETNSA